MCLYSYYICNVRTFNVVYVIICNVCLIFLVIGSVGLKFRFLFRSIEVRYLNDIFQISTTTFINTDTDILLINQISIIGSKDQTRYNLDDLCIYLLFDNLKCLILKNFINKGT
jgi:hypothetical protein